VGAMEIAYSGIIGLNIWRIIKIAAAAEVLEGKN